MLEESDFNFRYVSLCDLDIRREKTAKLFANIGDPDQMPQNVASDLGVHYLPITLLEFSRLKLVNFSLIYKKILYYIAANKVWEVECRSYQFYIWKLSNTC